MGPSIKKNRKTNKPIYKLWKWAKLIWYPAILWLILLSTGYLAPGIYKNIFKNSHTGRR